MTKRRHFLAALALAVSASAGAATAPTPSAPPLDCTILLDAASGRQISHEGRCDVRITPASTFKIALSLMGYDSGVLADQHYPRLPWRPGYVDWRDNWRAPTDPARWMRDSVVWYSQQIVVKLGTARWQSYVDRFDYGNRDLSDARHHGDPEAGGLPLAWVSSSLQISPDEEAAFLRKVVRRELGLAPRAYDMTTSILRQPHAVDGWTVYGKIGSGAPVKPDGTSDADHRYGWFVGWLAKGGRTVVFVRMAQDARATPGIAGERVRDAFLRNLPRRLAPL